MPPKGSKKSTRPVKKAASKSKSTKAATSSQPVAKKAAIAAKKTGRPAGVTKKRAAPTTQADGAPVRKSNRLAKRRPSMGPLSAPKRTGANKAAPKKSGAATKPAPAKKSPVEKAGPAKELSRSMPSTEREDNTSKNPDKGKSKTKSKSPAVSAPMRRVAGGRIEKSKSDKPRSKSISPERVVRRTHSR